MITKPCVFDNEMGDVARYDLKYIQKCKMSSKNTITFENERWYHNHTLLFVGNPFPHPESSLTSLGVPGENS